MNKKTTQNMKSRARDKKEDMINVYGNRIVDLTLQCIKSEITEEIRNNEYEIAGNVLISKIDSLIDRVVKETEERFVGEIKQFNVHYGLKGEPVTNPLMKLEDVKHFIIEHLIKHTNK